MSPHLKMLCVDDNADLLRSLTDQFSLEDFDVNSANNGFTALELIKKNHYDIVLLDVKMPRMDGMAVLKEMKKLDKHPYVIMLSGVDDLPTAEECVKLGASDFISKPYEPEELLHVVIKVLGA